MIINVYCLHIKYRYYYYDYYSILKKKLNFFGSFFFRKIIAYQNCMKMSLVRAELFHADRRTDRLDEANNRLSQFRERASN